MAIESNLCDDCMGSGVDFAKNICGTCKGLRFDPKKSKYTLRFCGVMPDEFISERKIEKVMARGQKIGNGQDVKDNLAANLAFWTNIIKAREVAKELDRLFIKDRINKGAYQCMVILRKVVSININ